jgi:hypothetical protein
MPPRRPPHWPFRLTETISGWFGGTNPAEWLTIGSVSYHADLREIDGRRYLLDIAPRRGCTREIRRARGRGTLSYDGTDTEVTFTKVTDRDVKHQVVIAYAAVKPRVILATGEHKNQPVTSFLVSMGLARDDTPEGLLPAVPRVTVFEVSPPAQARTPAPTAEEVP